MRVPKVLCSILFVSSMLLCPGQAKAQSATTGAVVGTVADPQQAAIAGAKIVLENININQTYEETSGSTGQYSFPSVVPGTYKLTATTKGFRTITIPNMIVEVAKSYTLDIKMEIGEVSQVVEVAEGQAWNCRPRMPRSAMSFRQPRSSVSRR